MSVNIFTVTKPMKCLNASVSKRNRLTRRFAGTTRLMWEPHKKKRNKR